MTTLSVLVLDTSRGCPAEGLFVALERHHTKEWHHIDGDAINEQGGIESMDIEPGSYRLTLDTGTYYAANSQPSALPVVHVVFDVMNTSQAALNLSISLSPFGYSVTLG